MSFLKVNKSKGIRKGSVYVASIEGKGLVIGTILKKTKISDIMIELAVSHITKRNIPNIVLLRSKKVSDVVVEEARLNAELFEYYDCKKEYLRVGIDRVEEVW